ncbi:MAG: allantoate amidohydrolase [Geminicoccaceae bacterium]|nr:MAG: allantoate amidohydrolase [Geminicoccaceae bacterium]
MHDLSLPDDVAHRLLARHDELAQISEGGPGVTRVFATAEHVQALALLRQWMDEAGMTTRVDAIGNLFGRWAADPVAGNDPKVLVLGSHHDTVRQGGRYDGAMGVLIGIACIEALAAAGKRLPFHVDVVAFADEEGTRFATSLLGSRAAAGIFRAEVLAWQDQAGIVMADAMRAVGFDPDAVASCAYGKGSVLAYVEAHLEQGPVLESEGLPVGVVTAIATGTRHRFTVKGMAGHAGTVPMAKRQDALAGAAEMVLACEQVAQTAESVVATIGQIQVSPGAINVIPGEAAFSLDLRAPSKIGHDDARARVLDRLSAIAVQRGLVLEHQQLYDSAGCVMDEAIRHGLARAIAALGHPVRELFSGAGHDALAMQAVGPVGMIFVRCKDGISHNPAEFVADGDILVGAEVMLRFLVEFAPPKAA